MSFLNPPLTITTNYTVDADSPTNIFINVTADTVITLPTTPVDGMNWVFSRIDVLPNNVVTITSPVYLINGLSSLLIPMNGVIRVVASVVRTSYYSIDGNVLDAPINPTRFLSTVTNVTTVNSNLENSVVPGTLASKTFPSTLLVRGSNIRFAVAGTITTGTSPVTLTFRVRMGTTLLGTVIVNRTTADLGVLGAPRPSYLLDGTIICRSPGVGGVFIGGFELIINNIVYTAVSGSTLIVDTTNCVIDITAQFSNATNSIISSEALIIVE